MQVTLITILKKENPARWLDRRLIYKKKKKTNACIPNNPLECTFLNNLIAIER